MKIISGSSNPDLAQKIAQELKLDLLPTELDTFANGERRVWIKGKVKGKNIAIIQSFSHPTDTHIIEFLLLADALERLGARHVNLILPWMGYSLQDKVFREGEPIAAKVVANLVSNAYVKRVFLLDLHNTSTPGFFAIPTEYLSAAEIFAQYLQNNFNLSRAIIASPDFGGLKRARVFANRLKLQLVNIDKHRDLQSGQVSAIDVHGDVAGRTVFLFDDCILSGSTVVEAAKILKQRGAQQVFFLATHGVFTDDALTKLQRSAIDQVIITNSIRQHRLPTKIKILDVAPLFARAIKHWL